MPTDRLSSVLPLSSRLRARILAPLAVALVSAHVDGQAIRVTPTISADETLTNNVNLAPRDQAQSDSITTISPGVSINDNGPYTSLNGAANLPILLYARTPRNNKVLPNVDLVGSAHTSDRTATVDGAVYVTQEYANAFGPRPTDIGTDAPNRFTTETYVLTPHVDGVFGNGVNYRAGDTNTWTTLSNTPNASANGAYVNDASATFQRNPAPLGWGIDLDRSQVKFQDQSSFISQLGRARGLYLPDPQFELTASAGYESNDYPLASYRGATYGAGIQWRPSQRSSASATYEHRFFGASYSADVEYRTALTVLSLRAARNTTSFPQLLAQIPAGTDIRSILSDIFSSQFPDPVQRQAFVNNYIASHGLPLFLADSINFYSQQIFLQETVSASLGLLGAKNTIFGALYRVHSQAITGSGTPVSPELAGSNDNTQTGGSLIWNHTLSGPLTLSTGADYLRTVGNALFTGSTRQGSLHTTLTATLTPLTSAYLGARYQVLRSDVTTPYNEAAVYIGISHNFR